MEVRIGTSGYHYKHWLGTYYPEGTKPGEMLAHYMRDFDTVELNRPFYRLPTEKAFEDWKNAAPPGFVYAVKGSRFITHMKKLSDPEPNVALFLSRAEALGPTLGPILFQLPPRWRVNLERLDAFLDALPDRHRYAFEFRDTSWIVPEVMERLRRRNAAFCIYDLAGYQSPLEVTADWVYVRLHGPDGAYAGTYSDAALAAWAERMDEWAGHGMDVYVYFDNDTEGHAIRDALRLKRLVRAPAAG